MPNHDEPTANDDERKAEPSANSSPNEAEPFAEYGRRAVSQWRSVQEVSEVEGLTERAIQKRCQRGYYVARLVEGDKGEQWQIDANSIKARANASPNRSPNKPEPTANIYANRSPNDAEPQGERDASNSDVISASHDKRADQHEVELLRLQLDNARAEANREREQSAFLKSQLEEANRNAAELRASLRAALAAMPKALPMATDAATPSNATPEKASGAPLDTQANNVPTDAQAPRKSPASRAPRPLWKVMFGIR